MNNWDWTDWFLAGLCIAVIVLLGIALGVCMEADPA